MHSWRNYDVFSLYWKVDYLKGFPKQYNKEIKVCEVRTKMLLNQQNQFIFEAVGIIIIIFIFFWLFKDYFKLHKNIEGVNNEKRK